ncbi:MAG: hypothetical protein GTO41_23735 [Burkholderiales bacterium]|nr:hypothetical protein [Burkholderiales bacterium]
MDKSVTSSQQTLFAPPGNGLALRWRLAITTVLIISVVMGGISIGQQAFEVKEHRQIHEKLLTMSLASLAGRLEAATELRAMEREVAEFHKVHAESGYPVREIVLLDEDNRPVFSVSASNGGRSKADDLQAAIQIDSPLLDERKGSLLVSIDGSDYDSAIDRVWRLWAVHFAATLGVLFLFLSTAVYFQVTKPVNQLIHIVTKMEMGYWQPIVLTSGAREIRWLAWRFGNMVQEVHSVMSQLLAAEHKAAMLIAEREDDPPNIKRHRRSGADTSVSNDNASQAYRRLCAVCERLETTSADDPRAAEIGRSTWRRDAVEAGRLGYYQIKARLENAALRLMEPGAYKALDDRLSEFKDHWQEWADQRIDALYQLLEGAAIPCVGVLHRVKHTAGVWAKMRSKRLKLNEIQDLFAFRIVVPTEADCYATLGIIHQSYRPVITRFKDYIASPKKNGYRSLHTCVTADGGPVFEIQIRSVAMDRQAERGDAAHWQYKEEMHVADKTSTRSKWWHRFLR